MRKLKTKKDIAKKERRNQFIVGGILILIMFGSIFGIIVNSFGDNENQTESINYNGFEFVNQNGFWFLELGDFQFVFQNNPEQIVLNESVNVTEINPLNYYSGKPLYVFSENDDVRWEIYRNFYPEYNKIVLRIQDACPEGGVCEGDSPTKTCEDNFIIIREGNESKIIQENSCVFIEGKKEDLMKLTDRYLFKVLGVE